MARSTLAALGAKVREKRGDRKLRDVAKEIGVGAATLMRIENGRAPDLATFGKMCRWLGIDPRPLLGVAVKEEGTETRAPLQVSAHFRTDQHPKPETVNALAKMILYAATLRQGSREVPDDGT